MTMTGDDIIKEARLNFGETSALSLTDPDFKLWVNTGLQELYELLPPKEIEVLAETATVALTNGKGPLPATLDHLLSVLDGDLPVTPVSLGAIQTIDVSAFFMPLVAVFATDGEHLWVRANDSSSVDVTFITPPDTITDFTADVILPKWHAALVMFVTAFAYAQEEDKGQAQHYRNQALALINRGAPPLEQEPQG